MKNTRSGRWSLGKNHEVLYRSEGKDEELKVRGSLIAAEPEALVIAVTQKQSDQETVTRLMKLAGTWTMDRSDRLIFEVEKEDGKNDVLTFQGSWRVDEDQAIVYSYETVQLKTKKKITRSLKFNGVWDIDGKNRLVYTLGGDSASEFVIRGAFQTKSILAKTGEIRYQLGAEAVGKPKIRTVTLFGKWRMSRDYGLSFEMEYAKGKRKVIRFGGDYRIDRAGTFSAMLTTRRGEPLGVELKFTRDLFSGDGDLYVSFKHSLDETAVEAGVKMRW